MADDKVDKKHKSVTTKENSVKLISCSKCKKVISKGETYIKLILTEKNICSDCDDGLFEGDNLLSIE